jgi:segregation and condensation protein B
MEEIRGVGLSKGTIDMLFEQGWIHPRGRRQTPGKPVTWGTTDKFLTDFGIESIDNLPGMDELKAAGLLDKRPSIQITDAALPVEEEPLSPEEQEKLAEDAAFLASIDGESTPGPEAGEAAGESDEPVGGQAAIDDESVADEADEDEDTDEDDASDDEDDDDDDSDDASDDPDDDDSDDDDDDSDDDDSDDDDDEDEDDLDDDLEEDG